MKRREQTRLEAVVIIGAVLLLYLEYARKADNH